MPIPMSGQTEIFYLLNFEFIGLSAHRIFLFFVFWHNVHSPVLWNVLCMISSVELKLCSAMYCLLNLRGLSLRFCNN